jgi:triosephosphate isomerase
MAGNWKMHKTLSQARELARTMVQEIDPAGAEVMLAPPFTALAAIKEVIQGSPVKLGAQNLYPAPEGAFTGEISAPMLLDLGVEYVILGHSERRHVMGETDGFIRDKVLSALEGGLSPILCVGEKLEEREEGRTMEVVEGQLEKGLAGLAGDRSGRLVIAYEPVWAIGTGRTATPGIAQEVHAGIRSWLAARFNKDLASGTRILYGGSVKGDNVKALMAETDIDGALVGGASLTAEGFLPIARFQL